MLDRERSVHFLQSLHEALDLDGTVFVGAVIAKDKVKTPNMGTTTADSPTPKESLWLADDAEAIPKLPDNDGVLGEHEVPASMVNLVASHGSVHSCRQSSWLHSLDPQETEADVPVRANIDGRGNVKRPGGGGHGPGEDLVHDRVVGRYTENGRTTTTVEQRSV